MKHLRFHICAALTVLFMATMVLAADPALDPNSPIYQTPSATDNLDTALYVLRMRRLLPRLFQPAFNPHYRDPYTVVEDLQKFLKWFETKNILDAYAVARGHIQRQKISVVVSGPAAVNEVAFTGPGLQSVRNQLVQMGPLTPEQVDQDLRDHFESMEGQSSQGILTGMIQSLPNDKKAAAFKLPPDQKMKFLSDNITDADLRLNFKSTLYSGSELSVAYLLGELNRLADAESSIAWLSLYKQWQAAGATDAALMNLLPATVNTSAPQGFQDKDAKSFSNIASRAVNLELAPLMNSTTRQVWQPVAKFFIEEVPPGMGVWSGCLNGECSTAMAYGFAFSPAERRFVVRDLDGNELMAIYSVSVMVNGKASLYVPELGSATVNPIYGEYIFRAFYEASKQMGYAQIILGVKGMHHGQFKTAAVNSMVNSPEVDVQYIDTDLRLQIADEMYKEKNNSEYARSHDVPAKNTKGKIYSPRADLSTRIEVNVAPVQEVKWNAKEMDRGMLRMSLFEALSRGHIDVALSLYKQFDSGASAELLNPLKKALQNDGRLPIAQYYENVKREAERLKCGWDDSFPQGDPQIFARGYIVAPDAWDDPNSVAGKQTITYVEQMIWMNSGTDRIKELVARYPAIVNTPTITKMFIDAIGKDDNMALDRSKRVAPYYANAQTPQAVIDACYRALESDFLPKIQKQILPILEASPFSNSAALAKALLRWKDSPETETLLLNLFKTSPDLCPADLKAI